MHLGNFDRKDLATTTTNKFPLFFNLKMVWHNPPRSPNMWVSLPKCKFSWFQPHIPNTPQIATLMPYSNKRISSPIIFIISILSTILFMFFLYTYLTFKLQYIAERKWSRRNLNCNCVHSSQIVTTKSKLSKLHCIPIPELSNPKKRYLALHTINPLSFPSHAHFSKTSTKAPHQTRHCQRSSKTRKQELGSSTTLTLLTQTYHHTFPLPLTWSKQLIPHPNTKKKKGNSL